MDIKKTTGDHPAALRFEEYLVFWVVLISCYTYQVTIGVYVRQQKSVKLSNVLLYKIPLRKCFKTSRKSVSFRNRKTVLSLW